MHDDTFVIHIDMAGDIRNRDNFYFTSLKLQNSASINNKVLAHIKWKPSNKDRIIINVDGVSKSNQSAGCGDLSCDKRGRWISGFFKNIGRWNGLSAELWRVLEGLQFALDKGYKKTEFQTDNKTITKTINKKTSCIRDGSDILQKIKFRLNAYWDVRIKNIHREANCCIYTMTNISH